MVQRELDAMVQAAAQRKASMKAVHEAHEELLLEILEQQSTVNRLRCRSPYVCLLLRCAQPAPTGGPLCANLLQEQGPAKILDTATEQASLRTVYVSQICFQDPADTDEQACCLQTSSHKELLTALPIKCIASRQRWLLCRAELTARQ